MLKPSWGVMVAALVLWMQPAVWGAGAHEMLQTAGVRKGICVVVGLPRASRPESVVELARGNELVFYVHVSDCREAAAVRKAAELAGLLGMRIFVDWGPAAPIHLTDNLADVALVASPRIASVAEDELLRVLHPGAKAMVGGRAIVKPGPAGTDDWSYPYHGPDNNPQSADRLARAPYRTQFVAEPKFAPSPAVTVAAGGRVFRACGHLAHKADQNAWLNTLLAINGYNGTMLWKRPLREGFMVFRNTLIATPNTVYLADDVSCKLLDAATGAVKDEIVVPPAEGDGRVWKWMALDGDRLIGLVGAPEFKAAVLHSDAPGIGGWPRANWPGFDYQDAGTAWAQGRTLLAIDLKTKRVLWRHREPEPIDGRAVCMQAGRLYFLCPEKCLGCLETATGKLVWKARDGELLAAIGPRSAPQPRWTGLSPMAYARCHGDYVFFSGPRMPRIVAARARDGKLAWQKDVPMADGGSVHLLARPEALYAVGAGTANTSFSMEYGTGRVLRRFLGRRGCTAATGSVDSIFYRAAGGTTRIDAASGRAEHIAPMRPPCYEGVITSGGMLYWGAWKCRCQLSLYGTIALTHAEPLDIPPAADASRLVKGHGNPAGVQPLEVSPEDWPTYLGDNARSATTRVAIPAKVGRRWEFTPASPGWPTAPVMAGGLAFVGDDRGAVRALDAATGKLKWKAYAGGAIFFPPAIWQGRLYVGSADGYVYAWEAATGRPLWKFLAAPVDRRIPVFGKLGSIWPVAGGVLVDRGVLYAAAGLTDYDGTYVYALDALTGKVRWCNDTSGRLSPQANHGVSLQGNLFLRGDELCFAGGNVCALATYDRKTGRCTSRTSDQIASGFRTAFYAYYPEFGQYMPLNYKLADGRMLNYSVDYSGAVHTTLALFPPLPEAAARLGANWRILPRRGARPIKAETIWECARRARYNSFIVSTNAVLAAGQLGEPSRLACFLSAIRLDDGTELWRRNLPAPVVKGGTAIDSSARTVASLQDGRIMCFANVEDR